MRYNKLYTKLFSTYFLISLVGLAILLLITRFAFRNFYYNETSKSLVQKARMIEADVTESLLRKNSTEFKKDIARLSQRAENRISIVNIHGNVLADSNFDAKRMENHFERKEVVDALKGEIGRAMRFSETLEENHLYVSIPLKRGDEIIGVLRNSVATDELETSLYLLTKRLMQWSALLLILLSSFIYLQAKKISLPLEEIKREVEAFAEGDFQQKIEVGQTSTVELRALIIAIKAMSIRMRRQFQKINKQKNEQLAVFGSMLEGVITIYPDMNVYHINKSALKLFNHQGFESVKGAPLLDIVKSERIFRLAQTLLENHKTVDHEFEYESGMILNVHGTILQSEETGMLGAVLVFNDVTKMRELENHRKEFVANVSHELKTPLTAIQGYLETIREEEIDDKEMLDKFLGIINKHSIRLKNIVEDLLSLSSIEKDSEFGEMKLERTELYPVIESIVSLYKDKSAKENIDLVLKGDNPEVMINSPLLEQAIINLLDNAVKYGPSNSSVIISLINKGLSVEIRVTDNGPGIPKEHHERLFERFYSVDKARSRELGGSGLGLSIVKHIAISHGGNVYIESEVGHGASFVIELPLA